jgi:DNA-binding XRE family transcriptional regulator
MKQAAEPVASSGNEPAFNSLGPFAASAKVLWHAGLAPIPVGGEDGKKPLVTRFTKWKRHPGLKTILQWIRKFPEANVGIVTGPLSGVSVVEIDSADPVVQQAIVKRFGETPLQTRTPSGGCHLWYRHNGEACADLSPEVPVQIKAIGGFVVVPPSVRPSGRYAGRSYEFFQGTLGDLARLPQIRNTDHPTTTAPSPTRLRAIREGWRNNSLFRHLKEHAPYCDNYEALLDVGVTLGQLDCDPPLALAEITKTVNSVWEMIGEGRLWTKGAEPRVVVSKTVIDGLGGDALKLYLALQLAHFDRRQFAMAPKAMAGAQVIPGWSHQRYRATRDELLEKLCLRMVHKGGSGPGDPSMFAFSSLPIMMGTRSVPNITKHPPPVSPLGAFPSGSRYGETPQGERPVVMAVGDPRQLDLLESLGAPAPRCVIDPIRFGTLVRDARRAKGLTLRQAAGLAGLSRSALGNIETATYPPGPAVATRLIHSLELQPP